MAPELLALAVITLVAATINGALGYGFSSITVPLALFFFTNRMLNPALVLLEVALNANVLWINREKIRAVRRRVFPIIVGLVPGVIVGTGSCLRESGWMNSGPTSSFCRSSSFRLPGSGIPSGPKARSA